MATSVFYGKLNAQRTYYLYQTLETTMSDSSGCFYGIEFFSGNLLFCSSSNETAEPIHLTMSIRNSRKDRVGSLCFISLICQAEIDLLVHNFYMHFNKLSTKN